MLRDKFNDNLSYGHNVKYMSEVVLGFIEDVMDGDLKIIDHQWWLDEPLVWGRTIYPVIDKIIQNQDGSF